MSLPIWQILQDGSATPIAWANHPPNIRFQLFGPPEGEMVLDQETGLVWVRNPSSLVPAPQDWANANYYARQTKIGNRFGWRLPTVEELCSLVDTRQSNPSLPVGHPFQGIKYGPTVDAYWTSTTHEITAENAAWFVNFTSGDCAGLSKPLNSYVWAVRGGRGGVTWNW